MVKKQQRQLVRLARPRNLDSKTWNALKPVLLEARRAQQQTGRFRYYDYLTAVFRAYHHWKAQGISKAITRRIAKQYGLAPTPKMGPIRILIEVTLPGPNQKQKSRWTRALAFAQLTKINPHEVPKLFGKFGGIAGCARFAARNCPKKQRDGWVRPSSIRVARRGQAPEYWADRA